MSEENVMIRVIPDGEKSKLKSSIMSINNQHSTSVRKLTSSLCTSTSALSVSLLTTYNERA